MVMKKITVVFLIAIYLSFTSLCFAATVSCEVKEVIGSTLVLENCDAKRITDFQKGQKVKVKLEKKRP